MDDFSYGSQIISLLKRTLATENSSGAKKLGGGRLSLGGDRLPSGGHRLSFGKWQVIICRSQINHVGSSRIIIFGKRQDYLREGCGLVSANRILSFWEGCEIIIRKAADYH